MGRPPSEAQNPQPPKSARESARGAGQERGAREVLGEVLAPCVSSRNKEDEHFPVHFPHLSEHSPEHFWGVGGWGFCTSVGGRPVGKTTHEFPKFCKNI